MPQPSTHHADASDIHHAAVGLAVDAAGKSGDHRPAGLCRRLSIRPRQLPALGGAAARPHYGDSGLQRQLSAHEQEVGGVFVAVEMSWIAGTSPEHHKHTEGFEHDTS